MDALGSELEDGTSLESTHMNLDSMENLLSEAETAAGLLGTEPQLSSVAISRRRFGDLKEAVG